MVSKELNAGKRSTNFSWGEIVLQGGHWHPSKHTVVSFFPIVLIGKQKDSLYRTVNYIL